MARRSRRSSASRLPYFAVGLALGRAVAAGVYFSDLRSGTGVPSASSPGARAQTEPAQTARQRPPASTERRGSSVEAGSSSTGDRAATASPAARSTEPSYEFYELLPQYEVVVPDSSARTRAPRPTVAAPQVSEPGSYVLQTGSFRSHADADRMQASLALLGVESRIQTVAIDDADYHRVRVGPVSDLNELNRIRSVLHEAGIENLVMRAP